MSEGSEDERATVEFEHTAGTLDMRAFGYQANAGDLLIGSVGSRAIDKETTMTLTEFLLARLAEVEKVARGAADGGLWHRVAHRDECDWWGDMPGACTCDGVARALADVEAKRRIVESAHELRGITLHGERVDDLMLQRLASAYRDHPDYDEAWSA